MSPTTAKKLADRYRTGGDGRPLEPTAATPAGRRPAPNVESSTCAFLRRWGPHHIDFHLHTAHSTVSAVLHRYEMPLLRHLDQNNGLAERRPQPRRYEH